MNVIGGDGYGYENNNSRSNNNNLRRLSDGNEGRQGMQEHVRRNARANSKSAAHQQINTKSNPRWTFIQNDFDLANHMEEDIIDPLSFRQDVSPALENTSEINHNEPASQNKNLSLPLQTLPEPIVTTSTVNTEFLTKFGHLNEYAILTRKGFKGADVVPNQDRAIVVFVDGSGLGVIADNATPIKEEQKQKHPNEGHMHRHDFLLGIFDGHGALGHESSRFIANELPRRLGLTRTANEKGRVITKEEKNPPQKGASAVMKTKSTILKQSSTQSEIFNALEQSFIDMNDELNSGIDSMSGSTASVILKWGNQLYIANAGDSRTFICTVSRTTGETDIVYISRPDKPDLSDEKLRIEASNYGSIYIPENGNVTGESSRVVVMIPGTISVQALAMSRSIGDGKAFQDAGVIPNPIVDAVDVTQYDDEDTIVFAVAASDGLMDHVNPVDVARSIGSHMVISSSTSSSDINLLSLCEQLILKSSAKWAQNSNFFMRYRDDISIAVTRVHTHT